MPRFRKKPIVIDAMQIPQVGDIDKRLAFDAWIAERDPVKVTFYRGSSVVMTTAQGQEISALPGEWVIPDGAPGRFYPCAAAIFAKTYDEIVEAY